MRTRDERSYKSANCGASRLHTGSYFTLTAVLLASTVAVPSKAEEIDHHRYHDSDYRHWKQPGTDISCCSDQDCAPVRAELRQGQWFALRQSEWFAAPDYLDIGRWLPLRRQEWIPVPDEKIIRERNPSGEDGHLCYSSGKVICFVPPNAVR
jgi:hypothetical protein